MSLGSPGLLPLTLDAVWHGLLAGGSFLGGLIGVALVIVGWCTLVNVLVGSLARTGCVLEDNLG